MSRALNLVKLSMIKAIRRFTDGILSSGNVVAKSWRSNGLWILSDLSFSKNRPTLEINGVALTRGDCP